MVGSKSTIDSPLLLLFHHGDCRSPAQAPHPLEKMTGMAGDFSGETFKKSCIARSFSYKP
jgi:hypothetical protein